MIDLFDAKIVEIQIDDTGKIWVNINGACALRIGHAEQIIVDDIGNQRVVYEAKDGNVKP